MSNIKQPAVAGRFYPADAAELSEQVTTFINNACREEPSPPKALIAPHAGYVYSGPTAGYAYAQLAAVKNTIHRVVILAPTHRLVFRGISISSADIFRTPLGDIEVDREGLNQITHLPQIDQLDQAFAEEHSLEVQLPFLQLALQKFSIIPLVVGDASAQEVAQVLELLWGGDETLIIISSDLSHFLSYEQAQTTDAKTNQAIKNMAWKEIAQDHACGRIPISGLLVAAREHNLTVKTLNLCNSGDTAGSHDRVVGYGSYAFYETAATKNNHHERANTLDKSTRSALLEIAKKSIQHGLKQGFALPVKAKNYPIPLQSIRASFVTLQKHGNLRGCIGHLEAVKPLVEDVAQNAFAAAFSDPRFPKLEENELKELEIHISVLTASTAMTFASEADLLHQLRPGIDGLILKDGFKQGTFLPSVWESLAKPADFFQHLKLKAGLPASHWSNSLEVYRYETEYFP